MMNADQRAYFDAFGFIVLRKLFSREEMDRIIAASERLWSGELDAGTDSTQYQTFPNFVERSSDLLWLIDDNRIHGVATDLLGERVVWASSEGNRGFADLHDGLFWHADRPGRDELTYSRVKMLLYLDPMSLENGALRVIPGSHRGSRVVGEGGAERAQKGQQVVPMASGDTVVIHSSLLHTTSGNYSGDLRIFASFFYTRAWLPKRESYGDDGMQRVIRAARQRGDRRVARLFEPDSELLARRFNGNNGEHTERQRWQRWVAEEGLERARAALALEDASDGATAVQDAPSPRPQAPPPVAAADPVATADAIAADDVAGSPDAAPVVAPMAAAGNSRAPAGPAGADAVAVPVLNARAELGEGPVWDAASGILYWVDLFAGVVHSYRPISGLTGSVEVGEIIGCVVPRQSGGLLAATPSGIYRLDPATGARTRVSAIEADRPETHFNDGKVDPAGRFWFGSIAIDRTSDVLGDLYSLETDLTVTHRLHGVDNTNGMDWSPDGRTMYYIDSLTRQVTAYDYDAAGGAISNPRPIVTLPEGTGVPDGMTVSVDGSLWVAHWGGARVTRWHPETGALLQTIAVPANLTTSCTFAGPAMDDLYITTARYQEPIAALAAQPLAGGLFRYRTDTKGRPAAVFPG
jgi:sugar lactone lactonase YvrE